MQKNKLPLVDKIGIFFLLAAFVVGVLILGGCATGAPSAPAPAAKYQLLLTGTIDGYPFQGVGVGSAAPSHSMMVQSNVAVDYFTVQSCHRSVQFNNIIQMPWYSWITNGSTVGFTWTYTQAPTIEDNGDCILRFCAFSNTVGAAPVSCAIVDFKSPRYQLPGTNICNGVVGDTTGTAICHTQVGLIERFQFPGPVVAAPQVTDPTGKAAPYWINGQCQGKFLDAASTLWEYTVPENECNAIFMEVAKPHRRAKLTVIPYDIPKYGGN